MYKVISSTHIQQMPKHEAPFKFYEEPVLILRGDNNQWSIGQVLQDEEVEVFEQHSGDAYEGLVAIPNRFQTINMNQYIRIGSELLPYPEVKKPLGITFNIESATKEWDAYNEWKSKAITIPDEHLGVWEEGEVVEESEFRLEVWCNNVETLKGVDTFVQTVAVNSNLKYCKNCYLKIIPITKEPAQQQVVDDWEETLSARLNEIEMEVFRPIFKAGAEWAKQLLSKNQLKQ
jgi:hypothetical protein